MTYSVFSRVFTSGASQPAPARSGATATAAAAVRLSDAVTSWRAVVAARPSARV